MVTEGNACGAIPEIERNLPLVVPAKLRGLPRRFAPRNDVFFFRLLSGAVLAHRTRRNAGDGVPYEIKHVGTPVPGCPPPLGAWVRTPREGCPYGKTCRAVGLRPPTHHSWWVPGRPQGSPLRVLKNPIVGTPVPGCPPPLGALIRTPREGCPYRDPRRERRPRRSVGQI